MKFFNFLIFFSLIILLATKGFSQTIDVQLNSTEIIELQEQARLAIEDFSKHITIIADKQNEAERKNKAIELAIKLFSSEKNIVQVSSLRSGTTNSFSVRAYLNKLKVLGYKNVSVTWYDIYLSKNFQKGQDGKYYSVATIFQKFEGSSNKELIKYSDVTKKNIQIIIEKEDFYEGTELNSKFIVRLGDIKVDETKFK